MTYKECQSPCRELKYMFEVGSEELAMNVHWIFATVLYFVSLSQRIVHNFLQKDMDNKFDKDWLKLIINSDDEE